MKEPQNGDVVRVIATGRVGVIEDKKLRTSDQIETWFYGVRLIDDNWKVYATASQLIVIQDA